MDHFALGGFLIGETDVELVTAAHAVLVDRWQLTAPLHSTKIRGKRAQFSWLSTDKAQADEFYKDLKNFILGAPIVSIACVIDRPGYVARYAGKYSKPWLLCQTAFAILAERASKYARERDCQLAIYFEQSGKNEDRDILSYMKALKSIGMPFSASTASGYDSLEPEEFRRIVDGEPKRVTKDVPMIQLADLVLYPMARGGYDETYGPFRDLHDHCRIIDAILKAEDIPVRGVKYSCFDTKKARMPSEPLTRPA